MKALEKRLIEKKISNQRASGGTPTHVIAKRARTMYATAQKLHDERCKVDFP